MAKPPGKLGKRGQAFRERDLRRAIRAAKAERENRIVRINRDGSIELLPTSESTSSEGEDHTRTA